MLLFIFLVPLSAEREDEAAAPPAGGAAAARTRSFVTRTPVWQSVTELDPFALLWSKLEPLIERSRLGGISSHVQV